MISQQKLAAETQKLRRVIGHQEKEIDALVKAGEKLAKERNDALIQLENTKKYIGSIVSTADLREKSTKEFKMVKEMTETIILKEVEISDLKKEMKDLRFEKSNQAKMIACQKEEIDKLCQQKNLFGALIDQISNCINFPALKNSILEFLHRVNIDSNSNEVFEKVCSEIASTKVDTVYLGDLHL